MKAVSIACLAGASLFIATTAFAADIGSEITNAQTHAGLAASAANLDGVHMHLHHALNCVVGPAGDGFDAKQMNPCAQSGSGALTDETDAAKKAKLMTADRMGEALAALPPGGITVFPLWPRAGEPAKRVILQARKSTSLIVRGGGGAVYPPSIFGGDAHGRHDHLPHSIPDRPVSAGGL